MANQDALSAANELGIRSGADIPDYVVPIMQILIYTKHGMFLLPDQIRALMCNLFKQDTWFAQDSDEIRSVILTEVNGLWTYQKKTGADYQCDPNAHRYTVFKDPNRWATLEDVIGAMIFSTMQNIAIVMKYHSLLTWKDDNCMLNVLGDVVYSICHENDDAARAFLGHLVWLMTNPDAGEWDDVTKFCSRNSAVSVENVLKAINHMIANPNDRAYYYYSLVSYYTAYKVLLNDTEKLHHHTQQDIASYNTNTEMAQALINGTLEEVSLEYVAPPSAVPEVSEPVIDTVSLEEVEDGPDSTIDILTTYCTIV